MCGLNKIPRRIARVKAIAFQCMRGGICTIVLHYLGLSEASADESCYDVKVEQKLCSCFVAYLETSPVQEYLASWPICTLRWQRSHCHRTRYGSVWCQTSCRSHSIGPRLLSQGLLNFWTAEEKVRWQYGHLYFKSNVFVKKNGPTWTS